MSVGARLRGLASVLATAAGDALLDVGDTLIKAKDPDVEQDEGQDRTPGGDREDTEHNAPLPDEPTKQDPKSLFWDPYAIIEQLGYKEKPSQMTYGTLRHIVWRMPILQAIIQTRVNQIASFAYPQHDRYQLGFRVKLRESDKEPTKAERDWMQQAETMLMRTGVTDNPRERDMFEMFLRKLARDSLMYDQACFEIVPNREGLPCEWYAIDAASIRLADSNTTYYSKANRQDVRYVQIYDGLIVTEYGIEDLSFGIRNPSTNIRQQGYGTSELEMLIQAITSLLYAWEYNSKFFSQGSAAKGLLNFKGAIPEKQLRAFRRHWYQMLAGVENAWRTPIVNADEVQWVNLQQSNRDMEFNAWFDFLIKVSCSMFAMDPAEINFKYGNTGQSSGLQEASNKEKITESKERGLRPLLRFIANQINQYIIWPINESFEFTFMGLDAATRDDIAKLNQTRVKTIMTVDELRAEDDLEPLPDGKGEVILDPTWLQFMQIKEGAMEGGDMGEGGPGDGGFGGGEDGDEGGGDDADFEALLRQYEEEEAGGGKASKPAKPAEPAEAEKSLTRSRRVRLDVTL